MAADRYREAHRIASKIGALRTQSLAAEALARLTEGDEGNNFATHAIRAWKTMDNPGYAHRLEIEFGILTAGDTNITLPTEPDN